MEDVLDAIERCVRAGVFPSDAREAKVHQTGYHARHESGVDGHLDRGRVADIAISCSSDGGARRPHVEFFQ